jgi:hypothetical protein
MIDQNLSSRASHLNRLYTILNYELSTTILFILQNVWQLTLFLAAAAAILFTPYMIFVLWKEKKYGWIIIFMFMVVLPLLIIILFLSDHLFYLAYLQIPLPLFYLNCFSLRFDSKEWLKEITWKIYYEEQKSLPKINNDFITLK